MYVLELNVGLDVSDNFLNLRKLGITSIYSEQVIDMVHQVIDDVGISDSTHLSSRVVEIEAEKIVIIKLEFETECSESGFVSQLVTTFKYTDSLGQDFIAMYSPDVGDGVIFGRYAEDWGEFNKACFIGF